MTNKNIDIFHKALTVAYRALLRDRQSRAKQDPLVACACPGGHPKCRCAMIDTREIDGHWIELTDLGPAAPKARIRLGGAWYVREDLIDGEL